MNRIEIKDLSHPAHVSNFYREIYKLTQQKGYRDIYINCLNTERVFPNACVPTAAAIQYYRDKGVDIIIEEQSPFLASMHFEEPLNADIETISEIHDPMSRIWRFYDSENVHQLTNSFVEALSEKIECEKGVIDSFEWCINEIMDNVLQHSSSDCGLVQIQTHAAAKKIAICIVDTGVGIFSTLKNTIHRPKNPTDAITLAIKEGVTRDATIGQGNGLWGLTEIVSHNNGRLTITSGPSSIFNNSGNVNVFDRLPYLSKENHGTIIDFQINASSVIDMSKALKYDHVSLRLENLETDNGDYIIEIKNHSHGTGTRESGRQLRNRIVNIVNEANKRVTLDFNGIGIVSSSFADEVIGKMMLSFGYYAFQNSVKLINMNAPVQGIVQKAITQRLTQSLLD